MKIRGGASKDERHGGKGRAVMEERRGVEDRVRLAMAPNAIGRVLFETGRVRTRLLINIKVGQLFP